MRLIDADALIEKLEAWKKEAERRDATINYTFASAIIAQVNAEPTIEERKRGEWIEAGKQMIVNLENAREQYAVLGYPHRNELKLQCSCCRKITMVDEAIAYNFCPHCGADMRGEQDE